MSEDRSVGHAMAGHALSHREAEVARLVAEDLSDKEIASILRLSVRTVQEYLDRIARKLACSQSRHGRRRAIRRWAAAEAVRRIADTTN